MKYKRDIKNMRELVIEIVEKIKACGSRALQEKWLQVKIEALEYRQARDKDMSAILRHVPVIYKATTYRFDIAWQNLIEAMKEGGISSDFPQLYVIDPPRLYQTPSFKLALYIAQWAGPWWPIECLEGWPDKK